MCQEKQRKGEWKKKVTRKFKMVKSCLKISSVKLHPHCVWLSFSQGKQNLEVTGRDRAGGRSRPEGRHTGMFVGRLSLWAGHLGSGLESKPVTYWAHRLSESASVLVSPSTL